MHTAHGNIHLDIQTSRKSPTNILRTTFRENGKMKHAQHGRITGCSLTLIKNRNWLSGNKWCLSMHQKNEDDLQPISALTHAGVMKLLNEKVIKLDLFDEQNIHEHDRPLKPKQALLPLP